MWIWQYRSKDISWGIQVTKSLLRVQPPFSMSISPGLVPPSKLQIQAIRAESQWQVCGEWVEPTQESHKKLHIRTLFAMRKYVPYISTLKRYGRADIYYEFIRIYYVIFDICALDSSEFPAFDELPTSVSDMTRSWSELQTTKTQQLKQLAARCC